MSYYQHKRQQAKNKNLMGVMLILLLLGIIMGIFYLRHELQGKYLKVDPVTLCPETGISEYVAVVFDKTDVFNSIQQQFLKRYFDHFIKTLPVNTQISLYVIDHHTRQNIQPDFVICKPRTGEHANDFYENPKRIRQHWQDNFATPLNKAIAGFMIPATSSTSPVMEIFQIIALTAFPPENRQTAKKIVLISDMLHHTSEWSHYREQFDFQYLKTTPYFQRIQTDLQGADVQILYLRRDNMEKLQTKRHAYFWADFIESVGGQVSIIERIDG